MLGKIKRLENKQTGQSLGGTVPLAIYEGKTKANLSTGYSVQCVGGHIEPSYLRYSFIIRKKYVRFMNKK